MHQQVQDLQKLSRYIDSMPLLPDGKKRVAYKGRWKVLAGNTDGAEGSVRSEEPMLNLPEISVPFEGVFRKAA